MTGHLKNINVFAECLLRKMSVRQVTLSIYFQPEKRMFIKIEKAT